jgi:glycosyltransferase involved in cell wall biosynthesis
MPILYLVLPCYNEEAVLPSTAAALREKMSALIGSGRISPDSRVVFVNDGSKDRTWSIIEALHARDPLFRGISLAHNSGHQNALLAGLMTVKDECDAAITLDADLQDDVDAIDKMLDKFAEGNEIVYGVRSSRDTDSFFKRSTALAFYRLMNLLGAETIDNHADFRLMSKKALQAMEGFGEVNLFLRGMVPLLGFKNDKVYYERKERTAGETKYPLKKMLAFAFEGITSFSVKPIRFITVLGAVIFLASIVMLLYFLIRHFTGHTVSGWTSLAVSIWALGGIQLLSLGIIGEYIGKVYLETKKRPRYVIDLYLK